MLETPLKLAIPSKGRLQQQTITWFAERGVKISVDSTGRAYDGAVDAVGPMELVLLPAAEIPRALARGAVHFGVTGQDLARDTYSNWADLMRESALLGFGHADLVVAVPAVWIDVTDMSDLDAVAAQFRQEHGHRLRVATKYHNLVRAFFSHSGVADYKTVDSQGATEGSVKNLMSEAIADITSSGATLRENHLKALEGGTILRSQATLYQSEVADWSGIEQLRSVFLGLLGLEPAA